MKAFDANADGLELVGLNASSLGTKDSISQPNP